jgi:hypothetical protein
MSNELNTSSFTDFIFNESDDSVVDNFIEACQKCSKEPEILNKNGSRRKVKRKNYKRSAKRKKIGDGWSVSRLQEIAHVSVDSPSTREGQYFRKRFRVPFPTFRSIVKMCKDTGEEEFNYNVTNLKHLPKVFQERLCHLIS